MVYSNCIQMWTQNVTEYLLNCELNSRTSTMTKHDLQKMQKMVWEGRRGVHGEEESSLFSL